MLRPIGIRMRPARLYSSAAEVTDNLCQWLDRVETPFFAWAHYMDLHWPNHMEEALIHPREIAQAWQDLGIMYGRSNFDGRSIEISPSQPHSETISSICTRNPCNTWMIKLAG